MRVFGTWHGGPGYGTGTVFDDMETWPSLKSAKLALWLRTKLNGPVYDGARAVDFTDDGPATVGDETDGFMFPGVDETQAEILLYPARRIGRKWDVAADHPYARLYLGPRGGVRIESV
ncbi:hypothetical protein AB0J38_17435 [Streptomyces sp. NPDC050095]|uniref:hypothetical protein n=1 Tax=unclassified Streptomyces TaxID=2593676 RepID=UPI003425EA2B